MSQDEFLVASGEAARYQEEAAEQERLNRAYGDLTPAVAERRRLGTLKAMADVDAGRLIDDEAMRAWADSLGTDQ